MPHLPKYGNEYVWDPRTILRSLVSFGFYRKKWEEPLPMNYPAIGYFENETFSPKGWVPTYPNPAFERCTNRDGYWGAKIVMAFRDEEIRAMVERGRYSDTGATEELTRLLAERRDLIGRYWFGRVNPLDRFEVEARRLRFADLAVEGGLVPRASRQWQYVAVGADGDPVAGPQQLAEPVIPIGEEAQPGRFFGYRIRSRSGESAKWSKRTIVFLYRHADRRLQLVADRPGGVKRGNADEPKEKALVGLPGEGIPMLALIAALLPAWSLLLPNEGGAAPELTTDPIKWFDADNKPIPEPAEAKENKIWDFIDKTSVYQVGKVLNLGWTARRVGNLLGIVGPRQADNVNALDEVPNSSWFTNRHFLQPMTLDELAEGSIPRGSGPKYLEGISFRCPNFSKVSDDRAAEKWLEDGASAL